MARADLVRAIAAGDLASFQENFEPSYLEDAQFSEGSLLHLAALYGTPEIVRFLLDQGAEIERRGGASEAPAVTYAAGTGKLDIVRILVEAGAQLDTNHPSRNPLMKAAYRGQTEVVKYLLSVGLDANACYLLSTGALVNALTHAENRRQTAVVELLKAHGCRRPVPGVDVPVWKATPETVDQTPENQRYGQIIEYIEERFGKADENGIHELLPQVEGMSLAISVIRPSNEHMHLTMFTIGMSDLPMTTPAGQEDWQYGELVIHLPPDWVHPQDAKNDPRWMWPITLLRQIAYYVHQNKTWFGIPGAIVSNEDPVEALGPNTKQTCTLLLPDLYNLKPLLIRADGKPLHFFTIVPLYAEERDFQLAKGMGAFLERFVAREVPLTVELNRPSFFP